MHRNDPASRLIHLQQQLGVSPCELAEEFGVSYGALAMWENGERSTPRVALKIIGIYEETIDQELALKAHEGVIRRLSSSWSAHMLATLGKGAKSRERSEIRRQLEDALYSTLLWFLDCLIKWSLSYDFSPGEITWIWARHRWSVCYNEPRARVPKPASSDSPLAQLVEHIPYKIVVSGVAKRMTTASCRAEERFENGVLSNWWNGRNQETKF